MFLCVSNTISENTIYLNLSGQIYFSYASFKLFKKKTPGSNDLNSRINVGYIDRGKFVFNLAC